jgi:hypothetical protein
VNFTIEAAADRAIGIGIEIEAETAVAAAGDSE